MRRARQFPQWLLSGGHLLEGCRQQRFRDWRTARARWDVKATRARTAVKPGPSTVKFRRLVPTGLSLRLPQLFERLESAAHCLLGRHAASVGPRLLELGG